MNININIHDHTDHKIVDELKLISDTLFLIIKNQSKIMADLKTIQDANTELIADVAAEDTVIASAVTLIEGFGKQLSDLQAELAAAIAANDPTAIQAVADSMTATSNDIKAQSAALGAAVTANTPAAPAPAPDPAPAS